MAASRRRQTDPHSKSADPTCPQRRFRQKSHIGQGLACAWLSGDKDCRFGTGYEKHGTESTTKADVAKSVDAADF